MTRLTVRGISKCISELQSLGELTRTTGGGSRNPNKYTIVLGSSTDEEGAALRKRSRNSVPGTKSVEPSANNPASEQESWNSVQPKTEPASNPTGVGSTPFGSTTNNNQLASSTVPPPAGSTISVPAGAQQLVSELERAGIVVGWRLTPPEWQRVTALSARWGASRLIEVVSRRWDPKRPPQSARYLLRIWDDLPSELPAATVPSNVVPLGPSRSWNTYRDSSAHAYQNGF
ncbi:MULTISPECIES: hypothetical protein [Streptacidiphilus]|uniref:Helix-turn-helix domain-containing protein n=1 Tax=Streptacidiphilus cavernicola TaxID=3342716 RepID=A0ABV6UP57_9ACTN|nr:hypothetical protein [Streptacidiphilus jeojiense]